MAWGHSILICSGISYSYRQPAQTIVSLALILLPDGFSFVNVSLLFGFFFFFFQSVVQSNFR